MEYHQIHSKAAPCGWVTKSTYRGNQNLIVIVLALTVCLFSAGLSQQAGTLDPSFESGSLVWGPHAYDGLVNIVESAGEGKLYLGGDFTTVRGAIRYSIARLNSDGNVDESFDPGTGADFAIHCIAVQSDGKVLVGGEDAKLDGSYGISIMRLNEDGSIDTNFNFVRDNQFFRDVYSILLQADNKILIAGNFTSINGIPRRYIARLNGDGTLDETFNPGSGPDGSVRAMELDSDGRLLIGGTFSRFNDVERSRIARLNSDGGLDMTFNPGLGATNGSVKSIAAQSDGKMVIGGGFTAYNGIVRNGIARLKPDGSLDVGFGSGLAPSSQVNAVKLQLDGKVVIGGVFTTYNGALRNSIARLNSDGSLDSSFDPGTGVGTGGDVFSLEVMTDGKVCLCGLFLSYNGAGRKSIAIVNGDGSLDMGFNPNSSADGEIMAIGLQADGKVIVAGGFTSYDGTSRGGIARLNADGSLDTSFDPGVGVRLSNFISSVIVQENGKILIAGSFGTFDAVSRRSLARLNSDGSLDFGFSSGLGSVDIVNSMVLQSDGKVVIGGIFTSYNGVPRRNIARLNSNGSLDVSFNPGSGSNSIINAVALQVDGKILIGGQFTDYNGVGRRHIARLNADGTLDAGFNPGLGPDTYVDSIAVQADGKILIGGVFQSFNGSSRERIARLNVDGSLDTSFSPGAHQVFHQIQSMCLQTDGKILVGGSGSSSSRMIARLNVDGALDPSFDPGRGANDTVASIAIQGDGKVLVGGEFFIYDEVARGHLARLQNDVPSSILTVVNPHLVRWIREGSAPEVHRVVFERSSDGVSWLPLGVATRIAGGWEGGGLSLSGSGFIRAVASVVSEGGGSVLEQVTNFDFPAEIEISGNGERILNGDSAPSLNDHTDFGIQGDLGGSVSRTYTIRNVGEWGLVLTGSPAVTITGSAAFSVVQQPASSIVSANGGSQSFGITYTPSTKGLHVAIVHIPSEDADDDPFTFTIMGVCESVPVVKTVPISNIGLSGATVGGDVIDGGGRDVIDRGVVYATSPDPTLASGFVLPISGGVGVYSGFVTGLPEGSTYFARAYASNGVGTGYGASVAFTTRTVVDFTDYVKGYTRNLVPGDRHFFEFSLSELRLVFLSSSGGAALRAVVTDATGNVITSYEGSSNINIEGVFTPGTYIVEIDQLPGVSSVQEYDLTIDASTVPESRPALGVGVSASALARLGSFAAENKSLLLISTNAKPITGHVSLSNRGKRPDALKGSATGGSSFFQVSYFGANGNVTAELLVGTYRTPEIDEKDSPILIRATMIPNKRKLTKRTEKGKPKILKKTHVLSLRLKSTFDPAIEDAATISVQTR